MRNGQVAFEFVIVLSVVLFLSTSIMLDFFQESNLTMMAGYTKNLIESQVGVLSITDKSCLGTYLESFDITEKGFYAVVRSKSKDCKPNDGEVAYEVEKTLCGGTPNKNNFIECGINEYIVGIEWKKGQ